MNNITQHMNSFLQRNFATFRQTVDESGIFLLDNIQLEVEGRTATVYVPTATQYMAEDLVEEFSEMTEVKILYHAKSDDGCSVRILIYPMPYSYQMYVIDIDSSQYGIVEGVTITFFDSIDIMLDTLEKLLNNLRHKHLDIVKQQPQKKLYQCFFSS